MWPWTSVAISSLCSLRFALTPGALTRAEFLWSCVSCQRGLASLAEPRLQLAVGSAVERVERGECFVRFHALSEVAVHACEADDSRAVDHEHRRSRQDPAAFAVELGHVDA